MATVDLGKIAAIDFIRADVLGQKINNGTPFATAAGIHQLVAFDPPHGALDRIKRAVKAAGGEVQHHVIDTEWPTAMQKAGVVKLPRRARSASSSTREQLVLRVRRRRGQVTGAVQRIECTVESGTPTFDPSSFSNTITRS